MGKRFVFFFLHVQKVTINDKEAFHRVQAKSESRNGSISHIEAGREIVLDGIRSVVSKGALGKWQTGRTPLRVQQSFKRRDGPKGLAERLLTGTPFDNRGWDCGHSSGSTRSDTKEVED